MHKAKLTFAALVLSTITLFSATAQAQVDPSTVFKAGIHYKEFDIPASATPKAVEFFSILCPACYQFEGVIHFLEKEIAPLRIPKVHVNFMRSAPVKIQDEMSKALIIGQQFGFSSAYVHAAFDFIHEQKQRFNKPQQVWDFARNFAPSPLDLEKVAASDEINNELKKWHELTAKMSEIKAVTGVPTLVINHRYVPIGSSVKTNDEYKQLIAYLLSKVAS